jgi:hypothetical protein
MSDDHFTSMSSFLIRRREVLEDKLAGLENQIGIVYEDERLKTVIKAKLSLINELLEIDEPRTDGQRKTYRVELVDYIDASTEHGAVDIFLKAIPDLDLADDSFDVYEVDPLTKKAVRHD